MKPVDRIVIDVESAEDPGKIGWGNLHKAGIGAACVYSYLNDSFTLYDDSFDARQSLIARILQADEVFGFMIAAFDLPVIFRTARTQLWTGPIGEQLRFKTFDLWRLIAAGMDRNPDSVPPKGFCLNDIARATLGYEAGVGKLMNAAGAPALFQSGSRRDMIQLANYVIDDVRLERQLVEFARRHGYLLTGATDGRVRARIGVDPWHLPGERATKIHPIQAFKIRPLTDADREFLGKLRPKPALTSARPKPALTSARVAEALGSTDVAIGDHDRGRGWEQPAEVVPGSIVDDGEKVTADLIVNPIRDLSEHPTPAILNPNPYAIPPGVDMTSGGIIGEAWGSPAADIAGDLFRIGEEIDKLPPPTFDPAAVLIANTRQAARDAGRDPDEVDPAICMNHGATFIDNGVPACGCSVEEVQNLATATD